MKIEIFKRIEKKYIIDKEKYNKIIKRITPYVEKDKFFKSEIINIYFDSDNFDLIRTSLEKPLYKEKVRLRSYGVPNNDDIVFLEIKKKYDGIVGKRRIALPLRNFYEYYKNRKINNEQIMKEIDYAFNIYDLKPKVFLSYRRYSYKGKNDNDFRITFDYDLKERKEELNLEKGNYGNDFFDKDKYIMEIKSPGSMPMWFVKILSEEKVYPSSYSKYGEVYKNMIKGEVYV